MGTAMILAVCTAFFLWVIKAAEKIITFIAAVFPMFPISRAFYAFVSGN